MLERNLFAEAMSMSDGIQREDIVRMLDLYCRRLDGLGYAAEAYADTGACLGGNLMRGTGKNDALKHAAWMCGEARKFAAQGRVDKAARWVGWIQGILWTSGTYSLDELRKHNRFI